MLCRRIGEQVVDGVGGQSWQQPGRAAIHPSRLRGAGHKDASWSWILSRFQRQQLRIVVIVESDAGFMIEAMSLGGWFTKVPDEHASRLVRIQARFGHANRVRNVILGETIFAVRLTSE